MNFKFTPVPDSKILLFFTVSISMIFAACTASTTSNTGTVKRRESPILETSLDSVSMSNGASMSVDSIAVEKKSAMGSERYAEIDENPFVEASRAPLSTFSIDVDTASYANVRRYLNDGTMPPKDAVRIEELVNYFEYDYPQPIGGAPFSINTEAATCAWNKKHKIVSIGLQGRKVSLDKVPPSNLVFLLDISGSMDEPDKLPLLKESLRILVNQLTVKDRIAIVVYAGESGLVLPSTEVGANKGKILNALNQLNAGGSTDGGQGIALAYKIALENFIQNGNNRVILATDGDFNLGLTGDEELARLIEQKRQTGIFLSVLGFGTGNTNDSIMEKLADKGNGNYAYIDSADEARKALGAQVAGTLYTIAEDVKIQVEFNPAKVAGYRLIGYENRLLADKDFNDERKDAGEIGAGHSVTALYEIVPAGQKIENEGVDSLRYDNVQRSATNFSDELLTVNLRYKEPGGDDSQRVTIGVINTENAIENASENLKFASSVAEFGLLIRGSRYKGDANFNDCFLLAKSSLGTDFKNYRRDFLNLIKKVENLRK